jgi:hypothetical protein
VLEASRTAARASRWNPSCTRRRSSAAVSLGLDLGGFYSDRDSAAREWSESLRIVADAGAAAGQRRERQVALKGNRTRVETAFGSRSLWRGDFAADFTSNDAGGNNGRWRFSLALGFRSATPSASPAWLHGAADYAAVFGVVAEDAGRALAARLRDAGAEGKLASVELALTLRPAAFEHEGFLRDFAERRRSAHALGAGRGAAAHRRLPERCDIAPPAQAYERRVQVLLGTTGVDLRDPTDRRLRGARSWRRRCRAARLRSAARSALARLGRRHLAPHRLAARPVPRVPRGGGAGALPQRRQPRRRRRPQVDREVAGRLGPGLARPLSAALAGVLLRELARDAGVPASALQSRFKLVLEGRSALLLSSG